MRRLVLALEQVVVLAGRAEQVAVEAAELRVDILLQAEVLDAVDGGGVRLGGKRRPPLSVDPLDLDVPVVDLVGQVRGRAALSPPPMSLSSSTTTWRPSLSSRYAVVRPAKPAPITHTSVRRFCESS